MSRSYTSKIDPNGESESPEEAYERPNPWFSIWLSPRATIQQVVDAQDAGTPHKPSILILAALAGWAQALTEASAESQFDESVGLAVTILRLAIPGVILGILWLYLGGAFIRWTGNWLGGTGTPMKIRLAVAWSAVPGIWALLLWLPQLALAGQDMFTASTPRIDALGGVARFAFRLLAFVLNVVVPIWSVFVVSKCVAQVQGFSAWRGFANVLLSILVGVFIFTAIGTLIAPTVS